MQKKLKELFEGIAENLLEEKGFYEDLEDEDVLDYLEGSARELRDMINKANSDDPDVKSLYQFALLSANRLDKSADVPTLKKLQDQFMSIIHGERMKTDKMYSNAVLMFLYPFYSWLDHKLEVLNQ